MYSLARQIRWNISQTETVLAKKNDNFDDDDLLEANIQITLQDPRLILGVEVHCFPPTSSQHLFGRCASGIMGCVGICVAVVHTVNRFFSLFPKWKDHIILSMKRNRFIQIVTDTLLTGYKYIKDNANKPSQEKFICRHQRLAGRLQMNDSRQGYKHIGWMSAKYLASNIGPRHLSI